MYSMSWLEALHDLLQFLAAEPLLHTGAAAGCIGLAWLLVWRIGGVNYE